MKPADPRAGKLSALEARLLAAAVGEADGGLRFLGYFYEEELFCGGLPPLMQAMQAP